MARRLELKVRRPPLDMQWDPEQALAVALAQRSRFLEEHPHHRKFQAEIDRVLEKAGTGENRMAVLAFMMESKLIELHRNLQHLNGILTRSIP
jgi:hypothetical protein